MQVLQFMLAWFVSSVVLGIFVGKYIRWGMT
jgi:hypothetical protein